MSDVARPSVIVVKNMVRITLVLVDIMRFSLAVGQFFLNDLTKSSASCVATFSFFVAAILST
jgi:hypothetical protein